MGIENDPDIDNYYTKACGFAITYSPEVIEVMHITKAELKKGGEDSEDEDMEGAGRESSSEDDTTSEEDGKVDAEDLVDKGKEAEESSVGQSKHKHKVLSSVDKVHEIQYISYLNITDQNLYLALCCHCGHSLI
jgi:hypothetical protein